MNTVNNTPSNVVELHTLNQSATRSFYAACSAKWESFKNDLVHQFAEEFSDLQTHLVRQAVDEADALASLTAFPQLFLPALAEEKVQHARDWNQRQQRIFQRAGLALAA